MQERQSRKSPPGRRRGFAAILAPLWILGLASMFVGTAVAQTLSVAETEALVRAAHFEGVPEEDAQRVGPEGAARLVEMLADPDEAASHANILTVLGLCGQPGAYEAITSWAMTPLQGEIDRNAFRAWQALPYALGFLARSDARAVARLAAKLDEDAPAWTFRHHNAARLHRQSRRAAATALGMTGLSEAVEALDRAEQRATDVEFERHLREVRDLHVRRAARRNAR